MSYEEIMELSTEDLVRLLRNGSDREQQYAMEAIVVNNEKLVSHLIKKYYPSYRHNYMEDLMNVGREALFLHAPDFDPDLINPDSGKPYRFSTYITPYIINALKLSTCDVHGITPHYAAQIKRLKRAIEKLSREGIDNPTLDMLAEEMGVGVDAVQRAYELSCQVNPISIEGDEKDKSICDSYRNSPDVIYERKEFVEAVERAVKKLPPDEYKVVECSYLSSSDAKEVPLTVVARKLGMDITTVRRLKNMAMRRLQQDKSLKAYVNGRSRYQGMDDFIESMEINFVISDASVNMNLDIAMGIDSGDAV